MRSKKIFKYLVWSLCTLIGCNENKSPLEQIEEAYLGNKVAYTLRVDTSDAKTIRIDFDRSGIIEKTIEFGNNKTKFLNFKDSLFSERLIFDFDSILDENSKFITLKKNQGLIDMVIYGSRQSDSIVVSTNSEGKWRRLGVAEVVANRRSVVKNLDYHNFYQVSFYQKPKLVKGVLTFEVPVWQVDTEDKLSEIIFNDVERMRMLSKSILETENMKE